MFRLLKLLFLWKLKLMMNNQIKKGWWIACVGFLFAFIIQSMLVHESYQYEKSLFMENVETSITASVDELSWESRIVSDPGKYSMASINHEENMVNILLNNRMHKYPLPKNCDRNLVNRQAFYDLCDTTRWTLDSLNAKVQNKTGIAVPIEWRLTDTLGSEIKRVVNGKVSGFSVVKVVPIQLGYITPKVLHIRYVFPFKYYLAVAGDRLYMAGLFFALLVFCFYLLFRTIRDEKKRQAYQKQLTDSLVHNLKNPIVACSTAFNAVKSMYSPEKKNEQEQKLIDLMDRSLRKAKHSVEDVLSTQATAHGILLSWECIDVIELFQKLIEFHESICPENKQLVFRTEVHLPEECPLMADSSHIYGALGNLIDNAIRYSFGKVEITLQAYREKRKVIIKVVDNGWGIPKEILGRIFESGYRGNSMPGGSGIGLHYTMMVAKAHHGTIRVESTEGKGSVFTLEIPQRTMFNNLKRKLCRKR